MLKEEEEDDIVRKEEKEEEKEGGRDESSTLSRSLSLSLQQQVCMKRVCVSERVGVSERGRGVVGESGRE